MSGIHYEDEKAEAAANLLARLLNDLRPFWPRLIPLYIGWMREQFESEGRFAGRPWAALSRDYAERKDQLYPGKGILVATGALRQAASRPMRMATPHQLVLTINDPKLEYHQTGTDKMPARPLVFGEPLPPMARAELDAAVEEYVEEIVRVMR